jgi:hypothetical protein
LGVFSKAKAGREGGLEPGICFGSTLHSSIVRMSQMQMPDMVHVDSRRACAWAQYTAHRTGASSKLRSTFNNNQQQASVTQQNKMGNVSYLDSSTIKFKQNKSINVNVVFENENVL